MTSPPSTMDARIGSVDNSAKYGEHARSGEPNVPGGERKITKRRLNDIYVYALPINCRALPSFVPHNPLSVFYMLYTFVVDYIRPGSSHPSVLYKGYFSRETQSVHVTDPVMVRALWERGFFGKGSLSRSDPSWLDREKRRRGLVATETSEEHTRARRLERKQMKYERALKEREAIEQQQRSEGIIKNADLIPTGQHDSPTITAESSNDDAARSADELVAAAAAELENVDEGDEEDLANEEHLQLSLEEAFFLTYGLGVLDVFEEHESDAMPVLSLLPLFRDHSYWPSRPQPALQPDDPFMIKYVVYHHFRSLGWVVRHGNKFSVDFLLYNRGPVFAHAEFAVIILPSYSHPYWSASEYRRHMVKEKETRDWWWFHCVNRVQAHVRKTLIVTYVDIPPPKDSSSEDDVADVAALLRQYTVREFTIRRWLMNRSRD